MVQDPIARIVTVEFEIVQTVGVEDESVTASPDDAVADTAIGADGNETPPTGENVTV